MDRERQDLRVKLAVLRGCYPTLNIPEYDLEEKTLDELTELYKHYLSEAHKINQIIEFRKYYLMNIVLIEAIHHPLHGLVASEMNILHTIDSTKELTKRLQGFLKQLNKPELFDDLGEDLSLEEIRGISDKIIKSLGEGEVSIMGMKIDPVTLFRGLFGQF